MGLLDSIFHTIGYAKIPAAPTELAKADREGMAYNPLAAAYQQMNQQYGLRKPNMITFQTLRRMAATNWVDRTCINTLRDEISGGVPWDISPIDPKGDYDEKFQKYIIELLRRPNRNNENWRTLIDKVIEDILVVDAGCIEKVRDDHGMIVELWHVDGATIKPKYDEHGVIGDPIAYEQYLPNQSSDKPVAEWSNQDLIYIMWNPQGAVDSFGFGMSPVEAGLAVGTAFLYAEAYNLNFFKSNSIPAMIINMGEEVSNQEVEKFRSFLASEMMGPQGFHTPIVSSFNSGFKVEQLLKAPSDMAWEKYVEWQMRWKVALYRMSPQDIGFTLDQYKVEGKIQQQLSKNKAIGSLKSIIKHYIDTEILADPYWYKYSQNLQFTWIDTDVVDPLDQATVDKIYLQTGKVSINELRIRDGEDPILGGVAPTMVVGSQLVKVDPTELSENEDGDLQPISKSLPEPAKDVEKAFQDGEGAIVSLTLNQSAIAWMDDRGVTQPLFITDSERSIGFTIKPSNLDDKKGQEPPEAEVASILRAMKVNTPEVKIMNIDQVMKLLPTHLYPSLTNWLNLSPPFDSMDWRRRWGTDNRKSNYYIVTGFISGTDLGDQQLQKIMRATPLAYKNAVSDLAKVWVAERIYYLGDRKPGHYIVTKNGNGFGVDYQFYKDKNSYLKTRHFLPRTLLLIGQDLKNVFDQEVHKAVEELGHNDMLGFTKAFHRMMPKDWERMEGFEDLEKNFAKSIQRALHKYYSKVIGFHNPHAPTVIEKAKAFDPQQDYLTSGLHVWQKGVRYPMSVLPVADQPTESDFQLSVADYRSSFEHGAQEARTLIIPNLPDTMRMTNAQMYMKAFEKRVNMITDAVITTIRNTINDIIVRGVDQGQTYGEVADAIRASMGIDITDPTSAGWRALRIARTETQYAVSEGMRQQYEDVGISMVNVSPAADCCDDCAAVADGNPYTTDEVEGLLPIHPNCRCVLVGDYSEFGLNTIGNTIEQRMEERKKREEAQAGE